MYSSIICSYHRERETEVEKHKVTCQKNCQSKENLSWQLLPHKENFEKGLISLSDPIKLDCEYKNLARLTNMHKRGVIKNIARSIHASRLVKHLDKTSELCEHRRKDAWTNEKRTSFKSMWGPYARSLGQLKNIFYVRLPFG